MERDKLGRVIHSGSKSEETIEEKIKKLKKKYSQENEEPMKKEPNMKSPIFESKEDGLSRLLKFHYLVPRDLAHTAEALSDFEFRVLAVMYEFLKEGKSVHIPVKKIAERVGRSQRKVIETIKTLEAKRILKKEKRRRKDGSGVYCKYTPTRFRDWQKGYGIELQKLYRKEKIEKYVKTQK
jgi:DNA-binding MarR family transcriptional regulator